MAKWREVEVAKWRSGKVTKSAGPGSSPASPLTLPLCHSATVTPGQPRAPQSQLPLTHRETERAAQQDLHTVLRLVDKGRIAVSEKTGQASTAAVAEIAAMLRDGDFYELTPKKNKWDQTIGPIKACAWPLLSVTSPPRGLHIFLNSDTPVTVIRLS